MDGIQHCYPGIKQEIDDDRSILLPAAAVLGEQFFHHNVPYENQNSSDTSSTKSRTSNESPEARARRLARNAQRMREKRANESYEEYKARLAKNAEANRRKRQMESEVERAMRQVKDAARQRLRRAMESPDQRSARLAKLAERMRMVRANESTDQRSERLKRSAARARERLSRETSEERRDRLLKRAEYARRIRAIHSSGSDTASTHKSDDNTNENRSSTSNARNGGGRDNDNLQTSTSSLLSGNGGQLQNMPTPQNQAQPVNMAQSHDFPSHSQNFVTLNNVKTEFNQFALNQNPLFLDLRSGGGYLNVPSYPNPALNMFPDSISSQVPPHLQNYVQSLSIHSLHSSQLGVLPNPNCFPVPNHAIDQPPPPSVIQTTSSAISGQPPPPQNSFLGQHHSPFATQPLAQHLALSHHSPSHNPTENYHHHQHPPNPHDPSHSYPQPPPAHQTNNNNPLSIINQAVVARRPSSPESNSNDSTRQYNRIGRPRKFFMSDGHGNPIVPEEMMMRDEVERQKAMNELLEEQINIILSSPKRHRGRPSKGRETDEERVERLRKMAESRRIKRANETPDERAHRLLMLTERARQRREIIKATETEEEKKVRLGRQAEYARRRRMREQLPDAKQKADQRAKELYAKLHTSDTATSLKATNENRSNGTVRPNYEEAVKLRIPNPGQYHRDLAVAKLTENVQSTLFEPIIEMQSN